MKVTILPSTVAGDAGGQFLSSYLINDVLAIDAGGLGLVADIGAQARVADMFLTHAHLDHVASLPIWIDNIYKLWDRPPTVYATEATLDGLRQGIFNGAVWPELEVFAGAEPPFVRFETVTPGRPIAVAGLRITAVEVDHAVPTVGYVVEEPGAAVVFSSDTGPTERLWEVAGATPDLKAVFLEASFPDDLAEIAVRAKHLTPATFALEVAKLRRPATFVAVHLKPRFADQVARELEALGLADLRIGRPGTTLHFGE